MSNVSLHRRDHNASSWRNSSNGLSKGGLDLSRSNVWDADRSGVKAIRRRQGLGKEGKILKTSDRYLSNLDPARQLAYCIWLYTFVSNKSRFSSNWLRGGEPPVSSGLLQNVSVTVSHSAVYPCVSFLYRSGIGAWAWFGEYGLFIFLRLSPWLESF